ncbi:MAG TPA: LacI family DNA-binding transcriptional regulator [Microlunatus sp.]
MATMQDVARLAQVSLSTVSYAINNTRPISAATRERVERAMRELDFRPNQIARSLASRRSNIVALTFPGTENALGSTIMEFVTSAAQAARERGYHLVVWPYAPTEADEMLQMSRQGLADGVVVMEVRQDDPRVRLLDEHRIPLTMIGRSDDTADPRCVDIDFDSTTEEAVAHLVGLGHTRIAFLNHSAASRDRGYGPTLRATRGFQSAMARRGLAADVLWCEETPHAGRRAIQDLQVSHPDVTALVGMNENAVIGVMNGLANAGYSVPQDFSILSIVSSPLIAQMVEPRLHILHSPGAELGRLGVLNLLDQLDERPSTSAPTLLPCRWEPGGSTGPVPTHPRRLR